MNIKALEVRMFDWFDDHWYKTKFINEMKIEVEEYFASVTTKLAVVDEPFLRRWYGQVGLQEALRVLRESADRGSRIHWAWQFFCNGGAVIYDSYKYSPYDAEEVAALKEKYKEGYFIMDNQDEKYQLEKLESWIHEVKPTENRTEQIVYDIEEKDAGTLDNLMYINAGEYNVAGAKPLKLDEGWYVADLKTGNNTTHKHKLQVARYSAMVEKMYDADKHKIDIQGGLIIHTGSTTKKGIEGLQTIHIPQADLAELNQDYLDIAKVWSKQCKDMKPKIRKLKALSVLPIPKVA